MIVLGFQPLKGFLQKATNKFLFKADYNAQDVLADLANALSSSIELEHIFTDVEYIIEQTFHPSTQEIYLLDKKGEIYRLMRTAARKDEALPVESSFLSADPFIQYLRNNRQLLVLSELKRRVEGGDSYNSSTEILSKLLERLDKLGAEIFLPLFSKDILIGIFVLGVKKSGDIYSAEDIRLLEIGGPQAAVAIENAQMYEEVRQFNITLEDEVKKATRQLRMANHRLKKLDQAKSEFISIASHQLRTPLTVIKGYISMMLEGSFGKLTPSEVESLHKVYESNQRLINLVEDLLNISRIESGRMQYSMAKGQLEELVQSVVEEIKPNADKRKLYLEYNLPAQKLPPISFDSEKLRQVFMNLVDNSVKYTSKGGIRVYLNQDGNNLLLKVADTGMGITADDMSNLFLKFSRGKGVGLIHTEGTGLGLFVAKQIVEAHGGKIWAESDGPDKGSTFVVSLPIVSKKVKTVK